MIERVQAFLEKKIHNKANKRKKKKKNVHTLKVQTQKWWKIQVAPAGTKILKFPCCKNSGLEAIQSSQISNAFKGQKKGSGRKWNLLKRAHVIYRYSESNQKMSNTSMSPESRLQHRSSSLHPDGLQKADFQGRLLTFLGNCFSPENYVFKLKILPLSTLPWLISV